MGRAIANASESHRLILWPLPDQRHLYMLVAGVVLGVVLGPAVMGPLAPQEYDNMFVGSGDTSAVEAAQKDLEQFLTDGDQRQAIIDEVIRGYQLVGEEDDSIAIARDEQITALNNRFADEEEAYNQALIAASSQVALRQDEHLNKLEGMATAMLLIIVILLAAEAILSPQRDELERGKTTLPPSLSRLVTVRYGLAAGWLMLMLAQPVWLRGIDPVFGGLLLLVVLVVGLVPLGKRAMS